MKANKISWLGLIGLIVIFGVVYLLDGHWQWASGIWG